MCNVQWIINLHFKESVQNFEWMVFKSTYFEKVNIEIKRNIWKNFRVSKIRHLLYLALKERGLFAYISVNPMRFSAHVFQELQVIALWTFYTSSCYIEFIIQIILYREILLTSDRYQFSVYGILVFYNIYWLW